MNNENPYAAPQTVEPLAKTAFVLPLAEERSDPSVRVLFPEISTQLLARIEAASRAIRRMTIVWTLALALLIMSLIMETLSVGAFRLEWLLLIASIIALTFRVYAGVERGESMRYYSFLVDLAPCLVVAISACLEVIQWPQDRPFPADLPLSLLLILAILYFPFTSVLAHWNYIRLFGDEQFIHDDLSRELSHRRRYRIP